MILVSVLGDFHSSIVPVFFEFKNRIKKHIVIHDDSKYDIQQLKKIIKGQKEFLKQYSGKSLSMIDYEILSISIDEDNYDEIIKCYKQVISYVDNPKELYLNTTDGLNSISIILSSKFLKYGANVIAYDRYANTYNLHTKNSMKKYTLTNNIDIKNHLKLKGYNLVSYADKSLLNQRKKLIYQLMQEPLKYKQYANFLSTKQNRPENYLYYQDILSDMGKLNNIAFIQGTVFEEYIYHLIDDNFDFDDVMTGVRIEFENNFENELDILMIKNNHLHTIECKFVNFLNGEHYIYKTNSIIDYLDDDGKAMILSIGGENTKVLKTGNKKTQFTKGDKSRAENGNIKIFQSKTFDEELFLKSVSKWFDVQISS